MSLNEVNCDPELARRRRNFAQKRSLSVYGVSLPNQPEDLSGVHPSDDRFKFFSRGRDFQPRKSKHRFTEDELRTVETFESAGVLPASSEVYRQWLQKAAFGSDSWMIICMVGVLTGILASVMKLVVEKCQIFYLPFISDLIDKGAYSELWIIYPILGCAFSIMSAVVVIFFCPSAAGSGLPEIIGILNGCVVRNVLNFKTLACKMISCICTVISTLPVGFEGPMVHVGALVGACMAKPFRCQSVRRRKKLNNDEEESRQCCPSLCRYRDCKERHALICVGAAAGVASAFSSPIAGLTFAMEEMSSHWSKTLTWQAFVCCILARATAELLHGLFIAVESLDEETGHHHLFRLSESALFDMRKILNLNMAVFLPAVIMGVIGGVLGSIFIFTLLKVSKFRRRILAKLANQPKLANLLRLIEVLVVSILSSVAVMASLHYATCKPVVHTQALHDDAHTARLFRLRTFQCNQTLNVTTKGGKLIQSGEFNEGASLLFGSWEQMIRNLLSRRTSGYFDIPIMLYILVFFLIFSSWTSITSIASGLLIPQLAIGALFGRIMGQLTNDLLQIPDDRGSEWDWLDPGALALLGAASFLSGTSRLPVTSVVMMVEMTNDVNISLLIMLCVMLSKFSGDLLTHSLYHSMLDFKCIPYLESQLKIYNNGKRLNLELFRVEDVMKCPVHVVGVKENIYSLANLLLDTNHGGFPVVQVGNGFHRTFLGVITRLELTILLTKTKHFSARELVGEDIDRILISYPEYSSGKLQDLEAVNNILHSYSTILKYRKVYVNLLPYINTSAISVPKDFSLYRAYMMFRFLGLRHMVVVDRFNQVEGIITRKDLLGYIVEKKLKGVLNNNIRKGFYIGSPTDSERSTATGSTSSDSPGSSNAVYEVVSRTTMDSQTPPQGLQKTVIFEEEEDDED